MHFHRFAVVMLMSILCSYAANAQKKYSISGSIKDKKTGEELIGATVKIAEQKATGVAANEYGFYSLTLPEGSYTLLVGYIGYKEEAYKVTLDKNIKLEIFLEPTGTELSEITISSKAKNDHVVSAQMGVEKLSIKDISNIPVLFGEKDVMKTLQLLPGVKGAGEGNSGFYVRGGAADQNLIMLDEAIVYNPSHLLGFFSTFNSDAIKDITLYKGGMPAQYGGRLSSVLDVKMNDGNNQDYHVSGGIGLISSKLNVEGPIKKDEGSFLISARRTYADAFLKLSSDTSINRTILYFYDFNVKANYRITDKDRIFLSGYFGKDKLGLSNLFGINWGNATGTLRWNHIINSKLFSNTSFIVSDYNYNVNINFTGLSAGIFSEIRDFELKEELDLFASPKNSVKFGFSAIYHTLTPGIFKLTSSNEGIPDNKYWENAVYIADSWKVSDKLNIDAGIRVSSFSIMGGRNIYELDGNHNITDTLHPASGTVVKTYINPEPRLSASYLLNEASSVKVGYARNSQYLHLITNSTTSDPTDKWVGSNNIIKPGISDQVSAGYFRNFKDNAYEFSVEGYYKAMQNQLDYKDGVNVRSNDAIEPQLLFGKGRAYGIELLLRKKEGKFTGWVSYTLSRTEQQIDGINKNDWYPARQDRTHDLSVVGIYQLSPKWTLSATFVYYTGDAVSFPSGKYASANNIVYYYTERNAYRFPDYHRLDIGATKQLKKHKHFSSELSFSVYNAYGRENAYTITFQQSPGDPTRSEALQTSLFRFIPSVSYNFKF